MEISFVIPCYRSEKTIEGVVKEIKEIMALLGKSFEIILVNDCSPDNTFNVLRELAQTNDNITAINLAKNFGQHSALMAGMRESRGDLVVCLDDDGQTPANELGKLLDKLDEGYDVVYASYGKKQHAGFRNFGSKINDYMLVSMVDKPKELYVSSYFVAKRFVINEMIRYEQPYVYVMGLVLRVTRNIANVEVNHRAREIGSSGYTLFKLLNLWVNGLTAFSIKPLRIATIIGAFLACSGFLYGIYTIVKRLIYPNIPAGFSATMSALVFIGGMLMLMLGLIGEYIGRIYICINNSPQYVIKEVITKEGYSDLCKTD